MLEKTDDQIEREKEAVQKMIGAKGAMENSLKRINTLENALRKIVSLHEEAMRAVGSDAQIKTNYHKNIGAFSTDAATIPVSNISAFIKHTATTVL